MPLLAATFIFGDWKKIIKIPYSVSEKISDPETKYIKEISNT
jgi:hypothetical protein